MRFRWWSAALCAAFLFGLVACEKIASSSPTAPPQCHFDRCLDRVVCDPVQISNKCKGDPL